MFERDALPLGWTRASLGAVTLPRVPQGSPDGSGYFTYIDIGSVDRFHKEITDPKSLDIDEAPSRARQHVRTGDVLVSMTRPNLNSVAMVPDQLDGSVASTGFDVLRADGVDPRWLFANVRRREFVDAMSELVQGALYPAVRRDDVRAFEIPLPPLAEQRRIVAKIDALQARSRRAREALEAIPPLIERFRQSVLAAAFRGDLTADWRAEHPDVEPASVLLERIRAERRERWIEDYAEKRRAKAEEKARKAGKDWSAEKNAAVLERERAKAAGKYKEPEPVDPEAEGLAELPEGWAWAGVEELVVNHDSRRVPLKRSDRDARSGPYPYYGASGVIDDIDDFLFDGDYLLVAEDGANLLARNSPIAFQAHGRFWVNNHAHVLESLGGTPLAYLEYGLENIRLDPFVTGSAQPKLTQKALNNIPMPVAPLAEQARIAELIASLIKSTASARELCYGSSGKMQHLDQAILAKAFRGELVPQDPDDEPASALLERIAAERQEAS